MSNGPASLKNPILSLLASSVGLSGLLVVVGFFIQQGIRSIIGVSARQPADVNAYLVDVAYFIEETLASVVDHVIDNWMPIILTILLIAAIVWAARRFALKSSPVRILLINRTFLFTVVTIAFLTKLFWVDWPVMIISDFFRKPATQARSASDFHAPDYLASPTNQLWLNLLRAHSSTKAEHRAGRARLEDAYAVYVLLGASIIAAALVMMRAKRDDLKASILICYAIMQLFLIAYAYGKFERSTFYPCVALSLREPANPVTQSAIMLSEDGQSVVVFRAADDRFHRVSWSEIREITLIGEEDVLAAHLLALPLGANEADRKRILERNASLKADGLLPRCLE